MSLKPLPIAPIPELTRSVAEKLYPSTHPMRVIGERLSEFVADADFADLYPREGKPGLSPALLAMVTVLQFMENLPDRMAAGAVVSRMDWKYALHLPLEHRGFHYSVLCEFRSRLVKHDASGRVFDRLLEAVREAGLVSSHGRQRTDAFSVLSAVRMLSCLEMVWETVRLALCALEGADVCWLRENVPLSWGDRYAPRGDQERLVPEEGKAGEQKRKELLLQIGADGFDLLEKLDGAQTPPKLNELGAVQTLRQIWAQRYVQKEGQVQWPDEQEVDGSDLIVTPHDPEARYAQKRGKGHEGYKAVVTETADEDKPHIITEIRTLPAPATEFGLVSQIQEGLEEKGLLPKEHLVDMGFMTAQEWVASESRGVNLVGPVRPDSSDQSRIEGGITAAQFELDRAARQARCPAGAVSVEWRERKEKGKPVVHVHFDGATCRQCPLRDRCVMSEKPEAGRTLCVTAHWELMQQRRREQRSEEFRQQYCPRRGIEGTLSEMSRAHGLRKARYRGIARVSLQHLMIAAATNLKRVARWLAGWKREGTRERALRGLAAGANA